LTTWTAVVPDMVFTVLADGISRTLRAIVSAPTRT
jgi:hypothetical protein